VKKKLLFVLILVILSFFVGLLVLAKQKPELISPLSPFKRKINYTPYSFDYLQQREYFKSEIKLEKVLKEEKTFTSYLFSFAADGRRITGMANIPEKKGKLPVVILLRGWVDEEIYQTGMGTERMADFLASSGFLTLAPDFLGYGNSDSAFPDVLQTRFFRPITVITLIKSINSLSQADPEKIAIWAHSNGGQIALSVLEITNKNIPTSLWAPVSTPFPDSILYYADEMKDKGKMIREVVAEFEKEYDFSEYSIARYLNKIEAPLIIHQGLADEAIPLEWTEELVNQLDELEKDFVYYKYPGENHNFHYGSAPRARGRDLIFFKEKLKI
jgi:dipeptidyl aminopeptidase/acylaminoacyl peptidase